MRGHKIKKIDRLIDKQTDTKIERKRERKRGKDRNFFYLIFTWKNITRRW